MNPAVIYTLDRALVRSLARRDDILLLPVLVSAGTDVPRGRPLPCCSWSCPARAERDTFRAWITQGPSPPSGGPLHAWSAETASNLARRNAP
ncbi:hypothetical protein [Streptomyces sp. NPDC059611]|uniref:hypothetical protein n=1 Tax=Streptomyces sp. NPDC059611 TaxID=3346884 RepID=UPI003693345C